MYQLISCLSNVSVLVRVNARCMKNSFIVTLAHTCISHTWIGLVIQHSIISIIVMFAVDKLSGVIFKISPCASTYVHLVSTHCVCILNSVYGHLFLTFFTGKGV